MSSTDRTECKCGISVQDSVADPVNFFPDPVLLRYAFDVSKINIFLWHFLTKSKHPITLKIKDKKLFGRNCILDSFITGKF